MSGIAAEIIDKEKIIYKRSEVGKLDTTKGIYHIYQFYEEPIECFIGKKLDKIIKRLGPIDTTETVMMEFEKFQKEHKIHNS